MGSIECLLLDDECSSTDKRPEKLKIDGLVREKKSVRVRKGSSLIFMERNLGLD